MYDIRQQMLQESVIGYARYKATNDDLPEIFGETPSAVVALAEGAPNAVDIPSHAMHSIKRESLMAKTGTTKVATPSVQQETSARVGRTPLPEDLRRTRRISVVVNDAEFNAITAAAAAAGDPASIWGRKIMMKAAQEK